jgi:hypothetical protein
LKEQETKPVELHSGREVSTAASSTICTRLFRNL